MANTFLDPAQVAQLAAELVLADSLVPHVGRSAATHFKPGRGASVSIRIPAVLQARTRDVGAVAEITADALTEEYQTVMITEQAYSAVDLTDADLALNLADFGQQVLAPQAVAVAHHASAAIAGRLATHTAHEALSEGYDAANPVKTYTAARRALREMQLPAGEMRALVGTQMYADLLDSGAFDQDGQATDAVGRVRGFQIAESNLIAPNDAFVYMREAVQLVTVTPAAPQGAGHAAVVTEDGLALMAIMDYDSRTLQDRSVVSTFIGTALLTARRASDGQDVLPVLRITA